MNADLLVAWGAYVLWYPEIFTQPETAALFSGMASMAAPFGDPATVWGLWAISVGLMRWTALFVNGAYSRTPIIRLAMAFLSAFVWTQVLTGIKATDIATPTIMIYACLICVDIYSAFRAASDVTYAEVARRDSAELMRNVGTTANTN